MDNNTEQFDKYLAADGPAALVIREHLMPVEGADAVFFPATFAAKKQGDPSEYNIDYENPRDRTGKNIALVDSVGSQANRIEPMFAEGDYAKLVPQITIKAGEKTVNLLEAGHRAGDAIARCSALKDELQQAFKEVLKGNALPLARIAPTSLVFGVWDSRDTQAKLPRLISSTVRAYDVHRLTRSATYFAPVDYSADDIFTEEEKQKAEGDSKNPLSQRGFVNALATGTHGGVIAEGGIRRDATLALSALKLLKSDNAENTKKLQRYILSLALVAFTKLPLGYYRQGTILVLDPNGQGEFSEVSLNGQRTPSSLTHETALTFAKAATKDFFGSDQILEKGKSVAFEPLKAKADLEGKDKKTKAKGKSKKEESPAPTPEPEGMDNA
ncbi:MAG: type I-U CRISPR-associated RAMP protein Csb1/Cas7u [Desulfuromonas thiophila]|nr:type I-U CRISPR-associated RAMP protein Csb1/Cas7u [Desulfuromonas thiophila]